MPTGLTDMEELLGRVQNAKIADYLREALTCYGTGAYRACVVLTFIAVFEDLRQKTKALVKVSSAAKAISADIEKLANGQKPFENQLVDQLASKELITELQAQRLKQIIDHRNKAAHPSGLHASAEEARFVFFEAVDKFLSEPVLSTNHAVDVIKEKLKDKNYFPSIHMSELTDIVKDELSVIHKSAHPYLVEELIELLSSEVANVQTNSRNFVLALCKLDQNDLSSLIYRKLIKPKASDLSFSATITMVISTNASLLQSADPTTTARLKNLLVTAIQSTSAGTPVNSVRHPVHLLESLVDKLGDAELFPSYATVVKAVINNYWSNTAILRAAEKSKAVMDELVRHYLAKAGSSTFDAANSFAAILSDIDARLAERITDKVAFELLTSISKAADYGAWTAQDVKSGKFGSAPALREKAVQYASDHGEEADNLIAKFGIHVSAPKFVDDWLTPVEKESADESGSLDDEIPF